MTNTKSLPEIVFEPFSDWVDQHIDDGIAGINAQLVLRLGDLEGAPLKLAQGLIGIARKGKSELTVVGRLWFTHDDDSLPPSPIEHYDRIPAWLRQIIDAYRKTETREVLDELARLRGIIWAAESMESDSHFNEEENEHRKTTLQAQDAVFGSREVLRERLSVAADALRAYVSEENGEQARQALVFLEQPEPFIEPPEARPKI